MAEIWPILGMTLSLQVIGQNLLAHCQHSLSVNLSSVICLSEPAFAAVYAILLFGEKPTVTELFRHGGGGARRVSRQKTVRRGLGYRSVPAGRQAMRVSPLRSVGPPRAPSAILLPVSLRIIYVVEGVPVFLIKVLRAREVRRVVWVVRPLPADAGLVGRKHGVGDGVGMGSAALRRATSRPKLSRACCRSALIWAEYSPG